MGLFTYDDTTRREDLLSIIRDVSPNADNILTTELGANVANNTLHQWLVRSIARPSSTNFSAEGADFAGGAGDPPTRSDNITAIIKQEVRVSGTEQAVRVGLPGNPMDDEKMVKLGRLKADMEYALINGAVASGASGTARGMDGIDSVISTNLTARSSGTSMSVTELEDMHENSWNAVGSQFIADMLLCPMGIKRKIATFTTRVTPNTMAVSEADKGFNNISFFQSSSGDLKIVPHKDVRNTAGTTTAYLIREDLYKMAFLKGREPKWEEISKVGDADRGMYLTELTLESLGESASVKRTGYAQNG